MSQHEEYQNNNLDRNRRISGLPDGDLHAVITALIEKEQFANAAEMLFGTERRDEFHSLDQLAWAIYIRLWSGLFPDLLKEVLDNHHWADSNIGSGLAMQVYPDEWFVLEGNAAMHVLDKMMG